MGFFDKIKDFGSRIVRGVRRGWQFMRDRVAPVISRVYSVAKPIVNTLVPGSKPITDTIDRVRDAIRGGGGSG